MSEIKDILKNLIEKKITLEEAEILLKANLIEQVGDLAKLDICRKVRTGAPEVIFAQNKNLQMLAGIISGFLKNNKYAIISRYNEEQKSYILENYNNSDTYSVDINDLGRIIVIKET